MPDRDQKPHRVIVLGADEMACAIAETLMRDKRFQVSVTYPDYDALRDAANLGLETFELSGIFRESLGQVLNGAAAIICANDGARMPGVIAVAQAHGCHYVDIAEDPAIGHEAERRANDRSCVVPACGLAPGFVTSLAGEMLEGCDLETDLAVRVGVLPAKPTNRLGYGLMWSIDGLIAEYTAPCLSIRDGRLVETSPLDEHEELVLDGEEFEAFNTAGSLDSLMKHYVGHVGNLHFKTLRYPGHLNYIRFLLDDLALANRLYVLRNLLMNGLPVIKEDRIVISMVLRGKVGSHVRKLTRFIPSSRSKDGCVRSAISVATAAHAASVVDILCSGLAPHAGLLDHSELTPSLLRNSPFFVPLEGETALLGEVDA